MAKRALRGVSRAVVKQSAREAAILSDFRNAYVRGQLEPIKTSLKNGVDRFIAKTGKAPTDPLKRTDRNVLLREIRRGDDVLRPRARIPEVPGFVSDAQRLTSSVLRRQVRDSAERVYSHATAQANALGLDLEIDRRAVLERTKRIMNARIDRYSKRVSKDMWLDIRRQTWRNVGEPVENLGDTLAARVEVYESRIRRIVVTESNRAYNLQMMEVMEQLEEQNEDKVIWKRWDATVDKRICGECHMMHGRVVSLHSNFAPWGIGFPPLHPFCRCVISVYASRRQHGSD